jgi:hypothetical protein
MTHTVESTQSKVLKKSCNPTEESFTVNQVIDAYLTGLNRGLSDLDSYFKKQLEANCNEVQIAGSEFLTDINSVTPVCKSAFLKIESINSFKIICVLQKDIYRDDEQSFPIYERSWDVSSKFDKKDIRLGISFMPYTDNINIHCLTADGYHLSYGEV